MDFKTTKLPELDIFRMVYEREEVSRLDPGRLTGAVSAIGPIIRDRGILNKITVNAV